VINNSEENLMREKPSRVAKGVSNIQTGSSPPMRLPLKMGQITEKRPAQVAKILSKNLIGPGFIP
jgi:hypothetical protein